MKSYRSYKALRLISIDYRAVIKSDALSKRCVKNILELCAEFAVEDSDFVRKLRKEGISTLEDQESFVSLYRELVEKLKSLLLESDSEFVDFIKELRPAYETDLPVKTLRKLYTKQVNQMVEELLW